MTAQQRTPIIAGNWKMNKTRSEAKALLQELVPLVKDSKADVVVCVPFTDIKRAAKLLKGTNIKVGAQNVAWADAGAFTGEISAAMLIESGAEFVIVGHSERRQYFGETDESVNKRLKQALKNNLTPIVCVGETLKERESRLTESVVKKQIVSAFADVTEPEFKRTVIAYEPVWAIGTGLTASAADAQNTIKFIRETLRAVYGAAADAVRIQYGGSMNGANAAELMNMPDIDGGLIGGASLKATEFSKVVNYGM
jgi:triosephosphate isomerase